MSVYIFSLAIILILIDFYVYQGFKVLVKSKTKRIIYTTISLIIWGYIIFCFLRFNPAIGQTFEFMYSIGILLVVYVPKFIILIALFVEDIYRFFSAIILYFKLKRTKLSLSSRKKMITILAIIIATIPFIAFIYGIVEGRYNYKIIHQNIFFADLPDAFDEFTITMLSDIHLGSFDNPKKVNSAIDLINQQKSDIIIISGDLVNSRADEILPWLETFNRIRKHKFGKYAVLGNHDYGEYVKWKTHEEEEKNFIEIKEGYSKIGFKLLLNENITLKKNNQKISLIGVENWGDKFKKRGDIDKASEGVQKEDFKIVITHDPSHWNLILKDHKKNIQLTLAGHTHGMQFGLEIPNHYKWSPIQYVYKQWAGLYQYKDKYIYVNRGFGFHAYPGRVGIMPEITVIKLKKLK